MFKADEFHCCKLAGNTIPESSRPEFFEKGPTGGGTVTDVVYQELEIVREFLHRQVVESSLLVPRPIDIGWPGG